MGMRKAINTKCKDCIYDPLANGTWLEQVFLCPFDGCGLYPYRPIPKGRKVKRAAKSAFNFSKKR